MPDLPAILAEIDAWFNGLGKSYLGRLPDGDLRLQPPKVAGWRVSTLGRSLIVHVDNFFPFSRPTVMVEGYQATRPLPHVEYGGKLCLRNAETPNDPLKSIISALAEARDLLRDIKEGKEDSDFEEDFTIYWNHFSQSKDDDKAQLYFPANADEGYGSYIKEKSGIFAFSSKELGESWWQHRTLKKPESLRRCAVIRLSTLPPPNRFPKDGASLWDLVSQRSVKGEEILGGLVAYRPRSQLVVLIGQAHSGRHHAVAVSLTLRKGRDNPALRREKHAGHNQPLPASRALLEQYTGLRLRSIAVDAAMTRLPYDDRDHLSSRKVGIVGVGALGSGVAKLLAKSGIGNLVLIDSETLDWENIRRHELGSSFIGSSKARALATRTKIDLPDISSATGYKGRIQWVIQDRPELLTGLDLIISCTASWSAELALDMHVRYGNQNPTPVLHTWMEANALATHAVLLTDAAISYSAGFDEAGRFAFPASNGGKPPPTECGGATTPFGAIELAQAQSMVANLAMEHLRGRARGGIWRTCLANEDTLHDAEGAWMENWTNQRGQPPELGGLSEARWDFR